ncbi:MAG TPA: hypothetical protein VH369_19955 [Bryobacteraceae bacterium]
MASVPAVKVKIHIPPQPAAAVSVKLPFPASPELRLAQLSPGPRFDSVTPFTPERWFELEAYRPRALAGETADLERLLEQVQFGMLDLASIDRAVLVLTRYRGRPMSDVSRVTLWQGFGVPTFELYLGPDNSLLAAECEAHEGWHLAPGAECWDNDGELILDGPGNYGLRTGLTATLEEAACPCGRTTPRLVNIEAIECLALPRRLAASA